MSLKDTEIHAVSGLGAALILAALIVPMRVLADSGDKPAPPPLESMEAIEATLAVKKTTKSKQPQKEKAPLIKEEKPEGVSRDETKVEPLKPQKPDPQKPNTDKPLPPDYKPPVRDPDAADPGDTETPIGQFDGSERGFADVSKGDPFVAGLVADMEWSPPELAQGDSQPQGCIQIMVDGTIPRIEVRGSASDDLETLAEVSLKKLSAKRNREPEPVPTHLLGITTKWFCFKFQAL